MGTLGLRWELRCAGIIWLGAVPDCCVVAAEWITFPLSGLSFYPRVGLVMVTSQLLLLCHVVRTSSSPLVEGRGRALRIMEQTRRDTWAHAL